MLIKVTKEKKMIKELVRSHLTGYKGEIFEVFRFVQDQVLECALWKLIGDTFN